MDVVEGAGDTTMDGIADAVGNETEADGVVAQAVNSRPTTIVVATRESEERIRWPPDGG